MDLHPKHTRVEIHFIIGKLLGPQLKDKKSTFNILGPRVHNLSDMRGIMHSKQEPVSWENVNIERESKLPSMS